MTVEQLHNWLVENSYNSLASNVNQAAGLMADAMSDEGGDLYIKDADDGVDFEDTPDAAGG